MKSNLYFWLVRITFVLLYAVSFMMSGCSNSQDSTKTFSVSQAAKELVTELPKSMTSSDTRAALANASKAESAVVFVHARWSLNSEIAKRLVILGD